MRIMIAIGLVLWATGAETQCAETQYMVLGEGRATSCGTWQQERRTRSITLLGSQAWVLGYVTRANHDGAARGANANLTDGTDAEGLYAWIDNYCRANPLKNLASAAEELVGELRKRK
jgi:hypothetical protein